MSYRLTGALAVAWLVAAAALPPAAAAQDPTVTPTPTPTASPSPSPTATPTPTPDPEAEERERQDAEDRRRRIVRRIYRDFERDGRVAACDHSRKALRIAKRSIEDTYDEDFPDFRDALQAAIDRHAKGRCEPLPEDEPAEEPAPSPTATPQSGSIGGGTTPPPVAPPPPPPPLSPEPGIIPGPDPGLGPDPGSTEPPPPGEGAIPEGTPAPPAPTPAPSTGPPQLVVTRSTAEADLLVPWAMLAVALIGLLIAGATAFAAKRSERFAGLGHAWREAAWRTSGTWGDFTDWLRAGR
jgi:hypothetical protein